MLILAVGELLEVDYPDFGLEECLGGVIDEVEDNGNGVAGGLRVDFGQEMVLFGEEQGVEEVL